MSYDLLFDASSGKRIDKRSFGNYFKARKHFAVAKGQAVYQNEDTGVYFIFDEPDEGFVAFNLNFYRPHVFGLEAAIELQAFSDMFGLTVTDPQGDGAEPETTFDRKTFLEHWNHGNRFAYQSMLKEADDPVHTWPAKRIREVWEWNYGPPTEDEWKDGDIFRPGIFAADANGQAWSIAIWPPECSILVPQVDALLIPLAQTGKASEDLALVKWAEILPSIQPYEISSAGAMPHYRVEFTTSWPPDVAAFLSKRRTAVGKMNGISLDEVLDHELVETARKT